MATTISPLKRHSDAQTPDLPRVEFYYHMKRRTFENLRCLKSIEKNRIKRWAINIEFPFRFELT